jgi:hypothetical protein
VNDEVPRRIGGWFTSRVYRTACGVNYASIQKVGKETNKVILKPGDTIRVIGSRGTAKIRAILTSVHGALLEKQIDGFPALES